MTQSHSCSKVCLCALAALASIQAFCQPIPYVVTYDVQWGGSGFDEFTDVVVDSSDNAYAIGVASPLANTRTTTVVKYRPDGTRFWRRDIELTGQTQGEGVHGVLTPSGVVVAGSAVVSGNPRAVVALVDPDGVKKWSAVNDRGVDCGPVLGGTVVFMVQRRLVGTEEHHVLVARQSGLGIRIWERDLGLADPTATCRMFGDGDGSVYVVFDRPNAPGGPLTTIEHHGQIGILWTVAFPQQERVSIDRLTPSGNFVVGFANSTTNTGRVEIHRSSDFALLRTDTGVGARQPSGLLRASGTMPVVAVVHGIADSYHAVGDLQAGQWELRGSDGFTLLFRRHDFVPTQPISDPCGNVKIPVVVPLGSFDEMGIAREPMAGQQFFPLQQAASALHALAFNGNNVYLAGRVGEQARLVCVNEQLDIDPGTAFAVLGGRNTFVTTPGALVAAAGYQGCILAVVDGTDHGSLSLNPDGSFDYTPDQGFAGDDSFEITVKRLEGNTFSVRADIHVLELTSVTISGGSQFPGGNPKTCTLATRRGYREALVAFLEVDIASVTIPSTVTLPAWFPSTTFTMNTIPVVAAQAGTLRATLNGIVRTTLFTVLPAVPRQLDVIPSSVIGGQPFTGRVVMTGKTPPGGSILSLTHSGVEVGMPTSLLIPGNEDRASFPGTTQPRSTTVTHQITASFQGSNAVSTLTLRPGGLFSVGVTPSRFKGGLSAQGRVNVAGIAPSGGTPVTLSVVGNKLTVPPSVVVPAGNQFVNFPVATQAVTTTGTRTLVATFGNITRTFNVTLTP